MKQSIRLYLEKKVESSTQLTLFAITLLCVAFVSVCLRVTELVCFITFRHNGALVH